MSETTTETTNDTTWPEVAAASAEAQAPETRTAKTKQIIEVKLTDAEVASFARLAAEQTQTVAEKKDAKKRITSELSEAVKEAEAERDRLLGIIATGTERRELACITTFDYRLGRVLVAREDTGEMVSERAMYSHERQPTLPGLAGTDDGPRYEAEDDEDPDAFDDEDGELIGSMEEIVARVASVDDEGPPVEGTEITDPIETLGADPEVKPLRRMARKAAAAKESAS